MNNKIKNGTYVCVQDRRTCFNSYFGYVVRNRNGKYEIKPFTNITTDTEKSIYGKCGDIEVLNSFSAQKMIDIEETLTASKTKLKDVISYFSNQPILTDEERAQLESCEHTVKEINKLLRKL